MRKSWAYQRRNGSMLSVALERRMRAIVSCFECNVCEESLADPPTFLQSGNVPTTTQVQLLSGLSMLGSRYLVWTKAKLTCMIFTRKCIPKHVTMDGAQGDGWWALYSLDLVNVLDSVLTFNQMFPDRAQTCRCSFEAAHHRGSSSSDSSWWAYEFRRCR